MNIISTTLSLLSFWNLTSEPNDCVPLGECSPLKWLIEHKESVPPSISNISEALRHLNCGFDDNGPKVLCSDNLGGQEDEEHILDYDDEDEEIDEYDELENEEEYDYSLRSGVIDGLSEDGNVCSGSLVCYVLHKDNFSVSKVVRRKRSIRGSVFRVEILGNCCWEAYERRRFRGELESYLPGFDKYPKIIVKSIQKVDCSQETN